jgi:2-haloacid dehalogenase/putative hydrolase of the HAD superfamily
MSLDLTGYKAITFDCFGTLIDWDTGVANFLGPWAVRTGFAGTVADVIGRFAEHQYANQRVRPFKNYRDVIRDAMAAAVTDLGGAISARELDAFAAHVGDWPAFADTIDALRHLKSLGLHLGVVSNVDNASFADTHVRLGGLIDTIVTAEMVGAYKPDRAMFEALFKELGKKGIVKSDVLHLAQSRFHDVAPGNEIGLDVVWIDRRHGRPGKGVTVAADAEPMARFVSLEDFCVNWHRA